MMNDGLKRCPQCKVYKSLTFFYPRKERVGQVSAWCKDCYSKHYKAKFASMGKIEKEKRQGRDKLWWWNFKLETVAAYGGKCACCGEKRPEFLSIDHIYGGGTKHRKQMGSGTTFLIWLRKQGFPTDKYRLLCMNCNFSHGRYGYCPHEGESAQ